MHYIRKECGLQYFEVSCFKRPESELFTGELPNRVLGPTERNKMEWFFSFRISDCRPRLSSQSYTTILSALGEFWHNQDRTNFTRPYPAFNVLVRAIRNERKQGGRKVSLFSRSSLPPTFLVDTIPSSFHLLLHVSPFPTCNLGKNWGRKGLRRGKGERKCLVYWPRPRRRPRDRSNERRKKAGSWRELWTRLFCSCPPFSSSFVLAFFPRFCLQEVTFVLW